MWERIATFAASLPIHRYIGAVDWAVVPWPSVSLQVARENKPRGPAKPWRDLQVPAAYSHPTTLQRDPRYGRRNTRKSQSLQWIPAVYLSRGLVTRAACSWLACAPRSSPCSFAVAGSPPRLPLALGLLRDVLLTKCVRVCGIPRS